MQCSASVEFERGRLALCAGEPHLALGHYARGVDRCASVGPLETALAELAATTAADRNVLGFAWPGLFLRIARVVRFGSGAPELPTATPNTSLLRGPVVILAGYCDQPASAEHEAALTEAFRGFRGTLISGGTAAGIVETVGLLQSVYPDTLHTVGYVPAQLPRSVRLEPRYREHRRSGGIKFSPLEPLQYWADLAAAELAVTQIRVLAIGGGRITACECQMALALGAPAAVIETPGSQAQGILQALAWCEHPGYRRIEPSAAALRAFVQGP